MTKKLFNLKSKYSPAGDQENAIKEIIWFLDKWHKFQTLWWVTWSWKTFTMANVIEKINKPTLIIAHNKTLAAQLAQEFKEFFPDNAVHFFVSYYDYYQPEAYVSKTDTYIEKEATINAEIDRLRHAATQDLLTRKDVIIVASVSCIYGIWDINLYIEQVFDIEVWKEYKTDDLLKKLISIQYRRSWTDFKPWNFIVSWDLLEIYPVSSESVLSIEFWWDEVTQISNRNHLTWEIYKYLDKTTIFPAKHTVTTKDRINAIIPNIKNELEIQLKYFVEELWDALKYERLKTKVEYDLEMLQEVWYVNWIENYSRYLDGRKEGNPPATLIDYFGNDFLTFVDESHMTFSQIGWMYAWDKARKENLVSNWFRLPSAMDNRPLKFNEFENKIKQIVAVSATPNKFEIEKSCINSTISSIFFNFDPVKNNDKWVSSLDCRIVSQIIRPTWLLDPEIDIKSMEFMVDDIMKNISEIVSKNERMLITTITKKSSEELSEYLFENGVKVKYLHSEIETLERLDILKELRIWTIDVIVWVNLLREWLDLPEVSKISIIDADKQWFLRSESALIQIIGRAARNSNWNIVMYTEFIPFPLHSKMVFEEDNINLWKLYRLNNWKMVNKNWLIISNAMKKAIDLTYYRRNLQDKFNKENLIEPTTIFSTIKDIWINNEKRDYVILDKKNIKKEIAKLELEMDIASTNMGYEKAAEIRDALIEIKNNKKRRKI